MAFQKKGVPGRACGSVQEGGSFPVLCLREAVQKKGVHGRIYGAIHVGDLLHKN